MIKVDARPGPIEIDPRRSAVIVVDMQNDFGAVGGMFERAGIDIRSIKSATEAIRDFVAAARAAEVPIVYLKMEHPPDLRNAGVLWTGRTDSSTRRSRWARR